MRYTRRSPPVRTPPARPEAPAAAPAAAPQPRALTDARTMTSSTTTLPSPASFGAQAHGILGIDSNWLLHWWDNNATPPQWRVVMR